jgi:PIN domain nuclease of toxin-antitoxin system
LILLDTNALLWLERGHPRCKPLLKRSARLYISPANLLELQFLVEAARIRMRPGATIAALANDARWLLDDPPAAAWFEHARDLPWTRDPFDRLLVAHARQRGWRIATGDGTLITHLGAAEVIEL